MSVKLFWDVVYTFDADQRQLLLKFVTSCSRPPLLGFQVNLPMLLSLHGMYLDEATLSFSYNDVQVKQDADLQGRGAGRSTNLFALDHVIVLCQVLHTFVLLGSVSQQGIGRYSFF